jgi:hypothetical protein
MGLFSRKPKEPLVPVGRVNISSGRHLTSSKTAAESVETLEFIINSYRPERRGLPPVQPANCIWRGTDAPAPTIMVACDDHQSEFLLATFTPSPGGSEIGLFPLGVGDDRLMMPIVGHWKQRDSSLSSVGMYPGNTVLLGPPRVPMDIAETTLAMAGRPLTPQGISVLHDEFFRMFLIKAHEFISSRENATQTSQILDSVKRAADMAQPIAALQSVLDTLAAWNSGVIPYISDLPWRCRAILLESVEAGDW